MMKRIFLILIAQVFALFFAACYTVTEDIPVGYSYEETGVRYQDKKFLKKSDMKVPDGVNERRFKMPYFLIGFELNNPSHSQSAVITEKEFKALKAEFESILTSSNRFPVAQIVSNLADADLRQKSFNGLVNLAEFDPAALEKAECVIHVTAYLGSNVSQSGRQKKTTTTMTMVFTSARVKMASPNIS